MDHFEHAPGDTAADFDPYLGVDRLLGADSGEIEVEDFLAEVVPLDVADEDGLAGRADLELGQVGRPFDDRQDVVAGERDRRGGQLVAVDDAGMRPWARSLRENFEPVPLFFAGSRGSAWIVIASAMGEYAAFLRRDRPSGGPPGGRGAWPRTGERQPSE